MLTAVLVALQLAATIIGAVLLWRRIDTLSGEVGRLRQALEQAQSNRAGARVRRISGGAIGAEDSRSDLTGRGALARAAQVWGARSVRAPTPAPAPIPPAHMALLGAAAPAPALAFAFGAGAAPVAAGALALSALIMTAGLVLPGWRNAAAWVGAAGTLLWAALTLALEAARAAPAEVCAALALAAFAGFAHVARGAWLAGAVAAGASAAVVLTLGGELGMVSAPGAAFGAIVAAAACVGAWRTRLEWLHLAAFVAALAGLFVLSGEPDAAIWFTPATAWAGAVFLGVAFVRTPSQGECAAGVAGVGALAPLIALHALHASGHGLADPLGAAAAFTGLAALFASLIALAASRQTNGLADLKLTLWMLAAGVLAALASAIFLIAPPAPAAALFALAGLGFMGLALRAPHPAWRALAIVVAGFAALNAWGGAVALEAGRWGPIAVLLLAFAAPAMLAGMSAAVARRLGARLCENLFEALAIGLTTAGATLLVRVALSDGAAAFAEAGAFASAWLIIALGLAARAPHGAQDLRAAAAAALTFAAVTAAGIAGALRFAPFFAVTTVPMPAPSADMLGLLIPALLLGAHWVMWRAHGSTLRTRLSLGVGALLAAGFATGAVLRAREAAAAADWVAALVSALCFALAVSVNFAPGVTEAPSRFDENLHRERARKKRRHMR